MRLFLAPCEGLRAVSNPFAFDEARRARSAPVTSDDGRRETAQRVFSYGESSRVQSLAFIVQCLVRTFTYHFHHRSRRERAMKKKVRLLSVELRIGALLLCCNNEFLLEEVHYPAACALEGLSLQIRCEAKTGTQMSQKPLSGFGLLQTSMGDGGSACLSCRGGEQGVFRYRDWIDESRSCKCGFPLCGR